MILLRVPATTDVCSAALRQESSDLQSWTNIGAPILGNGSMRFTPDNFSPQRFIRLLSH